MRNWQSQPNKSQVISKIKSRAQRFCGITNHGVNLGEKAHIAIESTVAMIKKLNMQIVAEGIEDKHQLDTLLGMGCDFIQGYYFSKPVPEKDFIEVLKKNNTQAVTV